MKFLFIPRYFLLLLLLLSLSCEGIHESSSRNLGQIQRRADSLEAIALLDSLYGTPDTASADSQREVATGSVQAAPTPISPPSIPQKAQARPPKTPAQTQKKPIPPQVSPQVKAPETQIDTQKVLPATPKDTLTQPPPTKPVKPDSLIKPVNSPVDTANSGGN